MTIGVFSLLVDRAGCPTPRDLPLAQAVELLGEPTRVNRDGRFANLVYEQSGPGGFWAFWFVDASLHSFEVHGPLRRRPATAASWFDQVEALKLTTAELALAGFDAVPDGDAVMCSGWSGASYCQAVFFDESLDRLIFGWAEGT